MAAASAPATRRRREKNSDVSGLVGERRTLVRARMGSDVSQTGVEGDGLGRATPDRRRPSPREVQYRRVRGEKVAALGVTALQLIWVLTVMKEGRR